jgi:xylulokinase
VRDDPCVLALDVGTSAIKVGLFRSSGELCAMATREQPVPITPEGFAEQSPEQTWRRLAGAVREVAAPKHGRIAAISVSNQRGTVLALDDKGQPLTEFVLWMDRRGVTWTKWLADVVGPEHYYRTCGHPIVPYTGISKLLWFQHEAPALFERASVVAPPQTWLLRRLGAEASVCDLSTGSFFFPFDIERRGWSEELAGRMSFPLEKLPALAAAVDVVGRLCANAADELGLPMGVPLVAGGGDGQCAGVGSGVTRPARAMVNVGTAAGVQTYLLAPLRDPARTLNCAAHVVPDAWEMEGHTQASGVVLRWLRDELSGGETSYDALIERSRTTKPGADGLLFLPTFNGTSAPRIDPTARGCLLGLTLTHGLGHVVRAVLEGVSLEVRWLLDAIREAGAEVEDVRLVGGGARNPHWNRIHANVLDRPVATLRVPHAATVGAAMCASVAIGAYGDLDEAAASFVVVDKQLEPEPAHVSAYEELYDRYRRTFVLLSEAGAFEPANMEPKVVEQGAT